MADRLKDFQEVLTEAVNDIAENGFDSVERVERWTRELRAAAERSLISEASLEQQLRDALAATYRRLVERGEITRYQQGVERFTLEKVRPALRSELDRRIAASANLIKLNRTEAIEKTLRRFQGWSTSVPPGGVPGEKKSDVKANVRKSMASLPFEERRVLIDQGHKLIGAINEIVAADGGAIAGRWRSNWRQPGYNYREDHKDRDGKIYLIRDSWAHNLGYVKKAKVGYVDEVTAPGQEPFCRCLLPSTEILSAVGISVLSRRRYDGPCVKIVTAAAPERPLMVTPNHPILTTRGWVPAETLDVGDDVIELVQQHVPTRMRIDGKENRPPTIAQIFDAAAEAHGIRSVRDSRMQFHGDGIADSDIDIVRPDRLLSFSVDSPHCRQQLSFSVAERSGFSLRSIGHMLGGLLAAAEGAADRFWKMRGEFPALGFAQSTPSPFPGFALFEHRNFPLFRASLAVLSEGSGRGRSDFDTSTPQSTPNCGITDLEVLCKRHRIPTSQIRRTKIFNIERNWFSGHVYNLQTDGHWYSAERIINHNCYYTFLYNLRDLPDDMLTAKGREALAIARGREEVRSARTARADSIPAGLERADVVENGLSSNDHAMFGVANRLDRLGYLSGLTRIEMVPDRDEWNAEQISEGDKIRLQAKFSRKPPEDQVLILLHEAGHRGQDVDPETWEAFKRRHLASVTSFVAIANPVHLKDFQRAGKVDGLAGEVFAESYARACLGRPLPTELAGFWQERFAGPPDRDGLLTQEEASYTPTWPNAVTRCQRCEKFVRLRAGTAGNACSVVEGEISARGHCDRFFIQGARTDSVDADPVPKVGAAADLLRLERLRADLEAMKT